jgi:hypothetical protein
MGMISRRDAFLGLAAVAAPAIIRTPGLLMPVRFRPPSEATPFKHVRPDCIVGPIRFMGLTPRTKAMLARAPVVGFWRPPPLDLIVVREAFRTEMGRKPNGGL